MGSGSDEGTPLSGRVFVANTSGLATSRKGAQIIYGKDTGKLWYDADGRKGDADAVHSATVPERAALSSADFELVRVEPVGGFDLSTHRGHRIRFQERAA